MIDQGKLCRAKERYSKLGQLAEVVSERTGTDLFRATRVGQLGARLVEFADGTPAKCHSLVICECEEPAATIEWNSAKAAKLLLEAFLARSKPFFTASGGTGEEWRAFAESSEKEKSGGALTVPDKLQSYSTLLALGDTVFRAVVVNSLLSKRKLEASTAE